MLGSRRTRAGTIAWGLPKGQIDPGETPEETAVREVKEEAGLDADIGTSLGTIAYTYTWDEVRVDKTVHFFLMPVTGGDVRDHDDELLEVEWVELEEALARAFYPSEREVLARAAAELDR